MIIFVLDEPNSITVDTTPSIDDDESSVDELPSEEIFLDDETPAGN